jgi:hypothetical protein
MLNKRFFAFFSALFLLIGGCAYLQTQVKHYKGIEEDFSTRYYIQAAEKIEKAKNEGKYEGKDRVLYYLDMGIALHFAGNYRASNEFLDKAEIAIEENFTKSISKMMVSFLLNDNVLDYAGEDYEDIFTNIIKTLNYLHLQNYEDAMVEVRRINLKLSKLEDKYSNMAEQLSESEKLRENSSDFRFTTGKTNLRYSITGIFLSMLGYKSMGEWDDVEIDRKKIIEASSGRLEDFSEKIISPSGENNIPVYTLCFTGKSPVKLQSTLLLDYDPDLNMARIMVPDKKNREIHSFKYRGDDELHLKFAVPEIARRKSKIRKVIIYANGRPLTEMYPLEDFGSIAEETFKVKKPIVYIRAALRTLIKTVVDSKIKESIDKKYEKENDDDEENGKDVKDKEENKLMAGLLKFAVDALTDVTENADLRCWRTMPGRAYAGRINLVPGEHEIAFQYLDARGNVVDMETKTITIERNTLNLIEGVSYQ